jgi:endonuclease VIII
MPEGHTIHRLARDHAQWFAGGPVEVSSPQGRFAGAARLHGQVLAGTDAWGKHLFHHYDGGEVVHVHLGLFGRFAVHGGDPPPPKDTVRMRLRANGRTVDLTGPTACDLLTPDEVAGIIDRLGPDPLRPDADPDRAWHALQRRRIGIGQALMDQSVVAGVGNVYRAEVLFLHGIHPEVPAQAITASQWNAMWSTLVDWLRYGARYGRIVTTDPAEIGRPRSRMRRSEQVHVYRRDRCRRCDTPIRRWNLANRWAYACETCQPPPRTSR